MTMIKTLSLVAGVAAVALSSGCVSTYRKGQITDSAVPGLPAATYKIVQNVKGEGSASMLSPSVAAALRGDSVVTIATNDAIGQAIYDNDNVDLVIAPKVNVSVLDLGIFAKADVTVKGVGVKITGPQ